MHFVSPLDRAVFIAMLTALAVLLGAIASMGGHPVLVAADDESDPPAGASGWVEDRGGHGPGRHSLSWFDRLLLAALLIAVSSPWLGQLQ